MDEIALAAYNFHTLKRELTRLGTPLSESPLDPHGRMPEDAVRDEIAEFQRLVDAGMRGWRITPVYRQMLDIAFGRHGMSRRLLLSNARIRERAGLSLIDTVSNLLRDRSRRFFFVTIFDDRGNALEYAPAIDLAALRQRLHAALIATGLHGFGAVELQAVSNLPQAGLGRTLMFHGHVVAWTDDPAFDTEATADRVSASGLLRNFLGARTVTIVDIARHYRQLRWRAFYMLKAPTAGKMVDRSQITPSGWNFKSVNVRADLAVRIMEALTQLEYADVLFAAGEGIGVQATWLADLQRWHQEQRSPYAGLSDEGDTAALWAALWARRRSAHRPPREGFTFDCQSADAPTPWESAAQTWLATRSATRRYLVRKRQSP